MGEVKEAWSRLVKVLSKAARNRRVGGRVSVPRYMPSDYRISSPPLEVLLTPTRPVTTPRFRVLLRPSALSDRTTMEPINRLSPFSLPLIKIFSSPSSTVLHSCFLFFSPG